MNGSEANIILEAAVARISSGKSYYWGFRDLPKRKWKEEQEVEIRINLPLEEFHRFNGAPGWTIVRKDDRLAAVFLKRTQLLTDNDVLKLFRDALELAFAHEGKFHSWMHGDVLSRPQRLGS